MGWGRAAKNDAPDLRPLRLAWRRRRLNLMRCLEVQPAPGIKDDPAATFIDDILRLAAGDAQIPVDQDEAACSELGRAGLVAGQPDITVMVQQMDMTVFTDQEQTGFSVDGRCGNPCHAATSLKFQQSPNICRCRQARTS